MSFSGFVPYGKSCWNYEYYVHLFTNIDFDNFQVNLEGNRCKNKIVLTKPPHSTPTYTMPKAYIYDTWTLYTINLNPYVSEL